MKNLNKEIFLKNSEKTLSTIYDFLENTKPLELESLAPEETSVIVVDLVEGFVNNGLLSSPRIKEIVPECARVLKLANNLNMYNIVFADRHHPNSPEYKIHGEHCSIYTNECDVVKEIKEVGNYTLVNKNSTNGFFEYAFTEILFNKNKNKLKNFVIMGDCTDICVEQLAMAIKAWFNKSDEESRVIIPINAVETYDYEGKMHNGDLMNIMSLYNMWNNGIELVSKVI